MGKRRGTLISIEGISGVGKSYFISKLKKEFQNKPFLFVPELSDRTGNGMDIKIISALKHTNDQFLRTGLPRTETFLLMALKIFDYESSITKAINEGKIIIEDRSIDSIAIYQSIMLNNNEREKMLETSSTIYSIVSKWRRPPDITFLLQDKFETSIERAQKRQERLFNNDEINILQKADQLYSYYALLHKDRIICLDRRILKSKQIFEEIVRCILKKKK